MAIDWNDLFVRSDVSETAPIGRRGGLGSPDIICAGTEPVDPTTFTTHESYASYYNAPIVSDKPNYLYVRARNSSPTDTRTGEVFLAMTEAALVLWPDVANWTRAANSAGDYANPLSPNPVDPGQIGVTNDPFVFIPTESQRWCLVTWLSTPQHPEPTVPLITSAAELAQYLTEHPNYAFKNIDPAPDVDGPATFQQPFSSGSTAALWSFGLQLENCKGFTVSFSCGTQLPNGDYITLPSTTVSQDDRLTLMAGPYDIPAGWQAMFTFTYDTNGLLPQSFAVILSAYYVSTNESAQDDAARSAAQPQSAPGSASRAVEVIELGSIGVMKTP